MANNPGVNKLARVINGRINRNMEMPLALDFGVIRKGYALKINTFKVPIPKGDYMVSKALAGKEGQTVKPGDRVLVAWVQDMPVVVCTVSLGKQLEEDDE